MTKFFKDNTDNCGLLCNKEECAKLCFSSRGSHQFDNCAGDVGSTINLNWKTIMENTADKEVAIGTTSSVRGTEVRGIGVYIEHHVRSGISFFYIGMIGHVV
jgi:hypothetical protein